MAPGVSRRLAGGSAAEDETAAAGLRRLQPTSDADAMVLSTLVDISLSDDPCDAMVSIGCLHSEVFDGECRSCHESSIIFAYIDVWVCELEMKTPN